MINLEHFALTLKSLIKEHNLTQVVLTEELELNPKTIQGYCQGAIKEPNITNLKKIAEYFNVSIDFLIGHEVKVTPKEFSEIFGGSLKQKCGIVMTLFQQVSFGSTITMLRCTRNSKINESKLYPRTEEANAVSAFMDYEFVEEDNYHVINGNIYRDANVTGINVDPSHKYNRVDTSIYDYVNEGNDIEPFLDAYETERFKQGMLGELSADEFYLLNYVLGYHFKDSPVNE